MPVLNRLPFLFHIVDLLHLNNGLDTPLLRCRS